MRLPNKLGQAERLKFLLSDTVVYGLGGALNKVLALFTFPLLTRYFSVEQFGVIDLLNTSVVVSILVFGKFCILDILEYPLYCRCYSFYILCY